MSYFIALGAMLGAIGGCGANKNHDQRQAAAAAQGEDPANCVNTCTPDLGSNAVDCAAAEAGFEFMDPPLWDFEESARALYTYTDGSQAFLEPSGYEPPVEATERCGATNALHLRGGLFRGWGGGLGIALANYPRAGCGTELGACEKTDSEFLGQTLDASHFDGVSFWARRGPDGQAGLRVVVGDKYTDDDLNVDPQKYCSRKRTCDCSNQRPCTTYNGFSSCWDPARDPPPTATACNTTQAQADQSGGLYECCGTDRCERPYPTMADGTHDPAFEGRGCNPYTSQSGETRLYCYNPGEDGDPPENYDTCGDHWTSTVHLSGDWQFFAVPFSAMRQQGFGKESPRLLTDEISVFRFTFDAGWIDYWIDNVRFYRIQR